MRRCAGTTQQIAIPSGRTGPLDEFESFAKFHKGPRLYRAAASIISHWRSAPRQSRTPPTQHGSCPSHAPNVFRPVAARSCQSRDFRTELPIPLRIRNSRFDGRRASRTRRTLGSCLKTPFSSPTPVSLFGPVAAARRDGRRVTRKADLDARSWDRRVDFQKSSHCLPLGVPKRSQRRWSDGIAYLHRSPGRDFNPAPLGAGPPELPHTLLTTQHLQAVSGLLAHHAAVLDELAQRVGLGAPPRTRVLSRLTGLVYSKCGGARWTSPMIPATTSMPIRPWTR